MENQKNEKLKQSTRNRERSIHQMSPEEFKKSVMEVMGNELVDRVEDEYIYFKPSLKVINDKTGEEINIPLTQQFIDGFFNSLLKKGDEEDLNK